MSSADAAWLHMDRPENLMVITAVMWFDEPLTVNDLRRVCRTRLVAPFPRFGQHVAEGRGPLSGPSWEDDEDFRVADHVEHLALPAPGGRAELEAVVAELVSVPLDHKRPLWRAVLIDGYGNGCAVLMRMHHCIADGIALSRVMLSMTDGARDTGIAEQRDEAGRGALRMFSAPAGAARSVAGAALHEGVAVARHPSELLNLAGAAERDTEAVVRMLTRTPDARTVLRSGAGVTKRVAWSTGTSLGRVKDIGHATDSTVNDVLLTAVAGSLGRYLRRHDDDAEEIHAMVPFNLRPLDEPLPRELGNAFGLVILGLPVAIEDPLARLAEVHTRMEKIKDSPDAALSYGVLGAMGLTPVQVEQVVIDFFSAQASAVMTNVPGPTAPVTLAGREVRGVLAWAPCSGSLGMTISIFSYAGDVSVGFLVDAGCVPDPQRLVAEFDRELGRLARAAGVPAR